MIHTMENFDIDAATRAMDASAGVEYGSDFAEAINTPDETLSIRRIARLAGIEMKRPFAEPGPILGPSETGARQQWLLDQRFLSSSDPSDSSFDSIRGDPSYRLTVDIYEELQHQDDIDTRGMDFGSFLYHNHSESNWMLAALRAAQPYICDRPDVRVASPTSPEKRRELWELAREAAGELLSEGMKKAVEPVCGLLCTMVPFLAVAPSAFVFGFSVFIVHFARRGFCEWQIQNEIVTALRWNQQ